MIAIDYQSKLPLYEQIADRFRTLILKGVLPPDSQMPSVRSLAVELSINPNTIQKAYSLLEHKGFIYSVKGRGNFVADTAELSRQEQASFMEEMKELMEKGRALGITKTQYLDILNDLYRKPANKKSSVF